MLLVAFICIKFMHISGFVAELPLLSITVCLICDLGCLACCLMVMRTIL